MNRQGRRANRAAPGVESLEGREVLSASPMLAPIPADLVRGLGYLDLQGSATGSVKHVEGIPDIGSADTLRGSGHVLKGGPTQVSGHLNGTGFEVGGHLFGSITLSNLKGSVTLDLEGPAVSGFTAPASGNYRFTVQKGTGAFSQEIGSGTVDATLSPKSFGLIFHGAPNRY